MQPFVSPPPPPPPYVPVRKAAYRPVRSDEGDDDDFCTEKDRTIAHLRRQARACGLGCVLLVFLLLSSLVVTARQAVFPSPLRKYLRPKEFLTAPEFPFVMKEYKPGGNVTKITHEMEETWHADMPKGRGFVRLLPESSSGSTRGIDDKDRNGGDVYVVSVFHQLHCLYMIQTMFSRALENASELAEHDIRHTYHCAELIRQALKCGADSTLDPTVPHPDHAAVRATTGWGGKHMCRDYNKLFRWAEEHRDSDALGAGDGPPSEHVGGA